MMPSCTIIPTCMFIVSFDVYFQLEMTNEDIIEVYQEQTGGQL